jgi:Leucine-rich repeat (LRR) protein
VSNQISTDDSAFLEKFTECRLLSLNNCKLNSLVNIPKIVKLEQLEAEDNQIESIPLSLVRALPQLTTLKLSGNRIQSVGDIKELKSCAHLRVLDLARNPIAETKDYRSKVREALPQLDLIDSYDKDEKLVNSEDEDFSHRTSSNDPSRQSGNSKNFGEVHSVNSSQS